MLMVICGTGSAGAPASVPNQTTASLHDPVDVVVKTPMSAGVESRHFVPPFVKETRPNIMTFLTLGSMRVYAMAALVASLVLSVLAGTVRFERYRRQLAEVEARRYLATMADLDRRAAMGHFAASIAHELRQPLSAILRNSEAATMLLASGSPSLAELQEILEDIRKDDKRAVEIIRRMKILLQDHERHEEPVDMNDVCRETVEFVVPDAAAHGARVQTNLQSAPVIVSGDRVHLQQVLLNLVLNALDALAHTAPEHRFLVVSTVIHNSHAEVSVLDRGSGIPVSAMRRMFEPFFSTKTEGMGMGLSIARSIVQAHSGRIVAENNVDRGATFRVFLPLRHHKEDLVPLS
jgi:signal transduction histidine kinase